jgi:hypothetical protein
VKFPVIASEAKQSRIFSGSLIFVASLLAMTTSIDRQAQEGLSAGEPRAV